MEHHVEYYTPNDDGYSFAEKYPDKVPPEPDIPSGFEFVFRCYNQLAGARTAGFSGPNPITYSEVKAFMDVTGTILRPHEVQAIIAVDNAWRAAVHRVQDRVRDAKRSKKHGK